MSYDSCPLGLEVLYIERVHGEKEIDDRYYSEIMLERVIEGTTTRLVYDTLYYRVDGSQLLQWTPGGDRMLYDFSFTVSDSLKEYQFFDEENSTGGNFFRMQLQDIKLLVDTHVEMEDGRSYRVVYGDDQGEAIDESTFHDTYMLSKDPLFPNWTVPFRHIIGGHVPYEEIPHHFYYVERFGVLYTPIAGHNNLMMIGFKDVDDTLYGSFPAYFVSIEHTEYPSTITLHQNYPNPFNPSTTIRYELAEISDVQLAVYDLLGRRVAMLVNEIQQPGMHQVMFDASSLSSGVYLYRLQAGRYDQTQKMVIIK